MASVLQYHTQDQYISRLADHKTLSHSQSQRLILKAQQGCRSSRDTIIESNMRLIIKQAYKYRNDYVPVADLIQEGVIGIIKALEKFDCSRGNLFSTYATWWIRHQITRTLANKSRLMRVPTHLHEKLVQLRKFRREVYKNTGLEPTAQEIRDKFYPVNTDKLERRVQRKFPSSTQKNKREAEYRKACQHEQDITHRKAIELTNLTRPTVSFDQISSSGYSFNILETFHDTKAIPGEATSKDNVLQAFRSLNPKEQKILDLHYALYTQEEPVPLKEIGQDLGISSNAVSKLHRKALKKMKHFLIQDGTSLSVVS